MIYSSKRSSIISYNLIDNKKIIEIKNDYQKYVSSFKHFFDDINKRDLVISISPNNIILWNINNFECLFVFDKIYLDGYINSSSFLEINNEIYIIASNNRFFLNENIGPIRVFTLQGIQVKEIKGSNEDTLNIETFFDNNNNKNYIICCVNRHLKMPSKILFEKKEFKSYDFEKNKIYCIYEGVDNIRNIIVYKKDNINLLIGGNYLGVIGMWNFDTGKLLKKFNVYSGNKNGPCNLCLWNSNYILIGCYNDNNFIEDKEKSVIKLLELKSGNIKGKYYDFKGKLFTIKKIYIPNYGECLLTLDEIGKIKLWKNKI